MGLGGGALSLSVQELVELAQAMQRQLHHKVAPSL